MTDCYDSVYCCGNCDECEYVEEFTGQKSKESKDRDLILAEMPKMPRSKP